jgi:hypothetical protein
VVGTLGEGINLLKQHDVGLVMCERRRDTSRVIAAIETTDALVNVVADDSKPHDSAGLQ